MPSDEPPRPVLLTDELRAQLNSVSTATLTNQLQRKGIRSTFLSGLKPIKPGQRMLGYAHTLRYVPLREDLNAQMAGGQNAQRRAVESLAPEEVLIMEARGEPDAGTFGDVFALRALRRGAVGMITDGAVRDTPAVAELDIAVYHGSRTATFSRMHMPSSIRSPSPGRCHVMPGDIVVGDGEVLHHPAVTRRRDRRSVCAAGGRGDVGTRAGRRRREHGRRVPRVEGSSGRVRGVACGSAITTGEPIAMGRKSIEIESFKHVNPIPAASRVGPLLVSSVIAPRDPGEQTVPETPEAQYANLFHHIGEMLASAGADWRHIARITFFRARRDVPRLLQPDLDRDTSPTPTRPAARPGDAGNQDRDLQFIACIDD